MMLVVRQEGMRSRLVTAATFGATALASVLLYWPFYANYQAMDLG
jgi:hypothetical protein